MEASNKPKMARFNLGGGDRRLADLMHASFEARAMYAFDIEKGMI